MPMLHGTVFQMTRIYEQLGQSFCKYLRYDANEAGQSSHLPTERKRIAHAEENRTQTCCHDQRLGGRSECNLSLSSDAVFPLSDHADYDDLIRYVDLVRPKRVLTVHGFAAEFARDLREKIGVEAWR